ncbi:MAG: saccharopine dehydrogenase, partial [Bacteroidota bacterium]
KDFRYDEAMIGGEGMSGRIKSYIAGGVLGILFTGKEGSLQKQLVNRLLPKPGEGPSKSTRENGYYKFKFFTTLSDGSEMLGIVTGDRDPGYGSTSKMLAESAICLAKDELSEVGGVLTPAVAMGDALLKRLQNHAGLTFSIAN